MHERYPDYRPAHRLACIAIAREHRLAPPPLLLMRERHSGAYAPPPHSCIVPSVQEDRAAQWAAMVKPERDEEEWRAREEERNAKYEDLLRQKVGHAGTRLCGAGVPSAYGTCATQGGSSGNCCGLRNRRGYGSAEGQGDGSCVRKMGSGDCFRRREGGTARAQLQPPCLG